VHGQRPRERLSQGQPQRRRALSSLSASSSSGRSSPLPCVAAARRCCRACCCCCRGAVLTTCLAAARSLIPFHSSSLSASSSSRKIASGSSAMPGARGAHMYAGSLGRKRERRAARVKAKAGVGAPPKWARGCQRNAASLPPHLRLVPPPWLVAGLPSRAVAAAPAWQPLHPPTCEDPMTAAIPLCKRKLVADPGFELAARDNVAAFPRPHPYVW
jgi:hypothetical protein